MTFIPAVIIFIFLSLRGMSPWPSAGLTLALIGGLTLLAKGRIAWLRPVLKGALDAAHSDGNVIGAEASQPAITDLPSINDGRRRS